MDSCKGNVLDGNAALSKKGAQQPPIFGHVYSGQTAGWIRMPLGMEIGIGPGHIVLDGDPDRSKRGMALQIFGPCLLWPNGWIDQNAP